jgi:hypothetical protein
VSYESEDFATNGGKWGPSGTFGTSGGTVTWSIAGANLDDETELSLFSGETVDLSSFLSFDFTTVLTQAFASWSAVADITFVQVADGGGDIGLGAAGHIRICGAFIDGSSSTLASAVYPATAGNAQSFPISGDIVFDSGESGFWTQTSFLAVAAHEIGHSIGLGHTTVDGSLMEPIYDPDVSAPQADDIAGAQAIYGPSVGTFVSISDATITEGNAGTQTLTFTVTRAGAAAAFAVDYATVNGSAQSFIDYVGTSGTLTFASDQTSRTISVTIAGDTTVEPDETFFVDLFRATNGVVIADSQGKGTITNDEDDFADSFVDATAPFGQVSPSNPSTGYLETSGDRDWFRVTLNAGVSYRFDLEGVDTNQGTLVDPFLYFYDGNGNQLSSDDDSGSGVNARITFSPSATGTYYAAAGAYFDAGTGTYRLGVTAFNTPPVATINNQSLSVNQWSQVQGWISYSDANGNPATQYQFRDNGNASTSGYFWTPGNAHHPANTPFTVAAADLGDVWVRGGQIAGSETMRVRAFDGTAWSAWDNFTLTTTGTANTPPVATINNQSLPIDQWSQVQGWISYSDANGNAATQYQFWDDGTAATSGYFWTPSNAHHPSGVAITVNAADLTNVWVRGGQTGGAETLWVRAFDGTDWSVWDSFTFTTTTNTPPVATINNHSLGVNVWSQVQSWISYSDANGNAATQYQFWDDGTASSSGYFSTPSNSHHPAGVAITVNAADLINVWVRGGQIAGSETLWVRAFDGADWSPWDAFTFTTTA